MSNTRSTVFDIPGVVWHPFGQAAGMTTTAHPPLVPALAEWIIPVVCPSGEDMLLGLTFHSGLPWTLPLMWCGRPGLARRPARPASPKA